MVDMLCTPTVILMICTRKLISINQDTPTIHFKSHHSAVKITGAGICQIIHALIRYGIVTNRLRGILQCISL